MDAEKRNGFAAPGAPRARVAFFVARDTAGPGWRDALAAETLRPEPGSERQEVLLDSFDRRLERAGIELIASGKAPRVRCRLSGAVASSGELELERSPSFVWDLPRPQALELARTLEARGLQRIGFHAASSARWAVLDEQAKTVAWIEEELHRVRTASRAAEWKRSAPRVVLRGVRGHAQEFERLARALRRADGLRPAPDREFDPRVLLAPPERRPGRWPILGPRVKAFEALARIARSQLEVLQANERGMRQGTDAEYLHDARIALRRLRSLLGQLDGILDTAEQEHVVQELRWLSACLGPARDLDTLLLELRLTEPELRAELAPLVTRLEHDRSLEQTRLRRALASARYAKLGARLRAEFAPKPDRRHAGAQAAIPFTLVVGKRLRRRLRQVVSIAEGLGAESPADELHELRIACKKLRYLLECCRSIAPKDALERCFTELKGLQGVLGTIQDARVHAELVNRLAPELAADGGARVLLAMGRFQERVLHRGRAARARHAELATGFLSPVSRAQFAELLRALERRASGPR